jgi:uncharacterized protein YndB with AHSA1/START domain
MTSTTTLPPVVVDVTVRVPIEHAFHAFTADFHRWWPAGHHIGAQTPQTVVLEPRTDGRWYEKAPDGVECDWGRVVAWEPPTRVELAWNLDGTWTYRPGPENASRVDVRFTEVEPGVTRVVLEHSNFEAHADTATALRTGVAGDGGWSGLVRLYTAFAEGSAAG